MRTQRGFSYLLLLFAVAVLGIAATGTSLMWSTLSQTERERELLFIGGEFGRALQRYYDASPTEPRMYPARLEDLTEDKRFQTPVRHLRKIYVDPMTGNRDWGLVVSGGQIRAIYSRSEKKARIRVLPPWVDTTGEKVASSMKTSLSAATGSGMPNAQGQNLPDSLARLQNSAFPSAVNTQMQTGGRASAGTAGQQTAQGGPPGLAAEDLRHADWLFIPVAASTQNAAQGGNATDGTSQPVTPAQELEGAASPGVAVPGR
ncbi:general secretion pathway protein [Methyloversatilis thermotolerans]|uniref:general secretion pathway protein n=1 Tax=Methyloversatilis thermotolerans TaxID=1346290 RepID=UPI000980E5E9|nr:general secretion pathway protein [Methyloversatilis thermotolerans]